MKFEVSMRGLDKLTADLAFFASKSIPYAARNGANNMAFQARAIWVEEIEKSMTLRNRYTVKSVRVDKATGNRIENIRAVLGSVAPYMAAQEDGSPRQLGGKHAIPTSAAAGQRGARPRTKLVRRPNVLSAIHLAKRGTHGSRAQRNAISMSQAARAGKRFVFLDLQRGRGLFRIGGGKRKPNVTMLWDLSRGSVRVPKNPTLERAVAKQQGKAVDVYHAALIEQAKRAKVLGY